MGTITKRQGKKGTSYRVGDHRGQPMQRSDAPPVYPQCFSLDIIQLPHYKKCQSMNHFGAASATR